MRLKTPGIAVALLLAWSAVALGVAAPHLTKKHAGWRKTACVDCHDAADLAKSHRAVRSPRPSGRGTPETPSQELLPTKPTECGPCHGFNGAPHEAHAIAINPCGHCHARVEHAAQFQAPGDCIKCHVHPESPQGR